jgi:hypothetical protein
LRKPHVERRPKKVARRPIRVEKRGKDGPLEWITPMLESAYTPLSPRGAAVGPFGPIMAESSLRPKGVGTLAQTAAATWRDTLIEYKQRKSKAVAPKMAAAAAPTPSAAFVPGARNWLPLGPTVVLDGQTVASQPVAGRVARLAVAPGGSVIYAASANGGVFRSSDGGTSWRSLMDRFDLDPTSFASASLVCGAIGLDPADPNRVYVGTGEGDTFEIFRRRITGALPAYRGVGMLRTDDGGTNWIVEPSNPDLAGEAAFAIAVDPSNRENAVVATTKGLYRRVSLPAGQFSWEQTAAGVFSSVVAASGNGTTRFYAALWAQDAGSSSVLSSNDGAQWAACGIGFPDQNAGRVELGVQTGNPNLVYAFVAQQTKGGALGLYRLQGGATSQWVKVNGLPDVLPLDDQGNSQGGYDLAVAVDPLDANIVYLGGSYANVDPFPGSVWRCEIAPTAALFTVTTSASIGTHAHSDVHFLTHTPGEPNELWCTCDGGVFLNRNPRRDGEFASQNNGLACLCCNFIAQDPTDPNVLFTGLQDNGTARTGAGPIWTHVGFGDGGYCLVNWARPIDVLAYMNGNVTRSTTGGTSHDGWSVVWNISWPTMTQPIVGAPYNPARPADAEIVALGAGNLVFVSNDFATSWPMQFEIPEDAGDVFALAFATPSRLFVGTTIGRVFRADQSDGGWSAIRLDDVAAGPIGLDGLISDVAVDWADATGASCYVCFGGRGDRRRVWRFDGTRWESRSGAPGGNDLLDVEHNAIAVDRGAPGNIYVGADIGVWHSSDAGLNWTPLENGLPEAPVYDLQIHPTQRLLRAATHGRGVYELALD